MAKNETSKSALDTELAAWLNDARRYGKLGVLALFGSWLFSQKPGRQALGRLFKIAGLAKNRLAMETLPVLRDAIGWSTHEYKQARENALVNLVLLGFTGLSCIMAGAFIPSLLWKSIVVVTGDVIAFYLVHEFWARRIVPLIAIGVANGYLKGIEESTLDSMSSFGKFLFHGPTEGLPTGLQWVGQLWRICSMVAFWFIVGSQYIIWVPLAGVKPLLFAALPCIPVFYIGTCIWGPKVRGREISWILWAELAMLIDIAFLAVFKAELYQPIVDGELTARVWMMSILVVETIGIIYLVNRMRRPAVALVPSGGQLIGVGGAIPSRQIIYKQPRPVNTYAVVAIVFLVLIIGGLLVHELGVHKPEAFTVETVVK